MLHRLNRQAAEHMDAPYITCEYADAQGPQCRAADTLHLNNVGHARLAHTVGRAVLDALSIPSEEGVGIFPDILGDPMWGQLPGDKLDSGPQSI